MRKSHVNSREYGLKFAYLIALLLTLIVLAACGDDENGNNAAVPDVPTETTTTEDNAATSTTPTGSALTDIPTPMGNLWRGLSFEQAQALAPFPLIWPDPALSWVTLDGAIAVGPPSVTNEGEGLPYEVAVYLIVDHGDSGDARVSLTQTTMQSSVSIGADTTETTVGISGREVTQVIQERVGDPVITYTWSNEGVTYTLMSAAGIDEERLEEIIASMI